MSCAWDVKCLTCNDQLGMGVNHGDSLMRSLILHAKQITALGPLVRAAGWEVSIEAGGSGLNIPWFEIHADHHLKPIDEYGQLDGECGKRITCGECGHDDHCRLLEGHDGPHARKAKP